MPVRFNKHMKGFHNWIGTRSVNIIPLKNIGDDAQITWLG